jgi:hypothetical protein
MMSLSILLVGALGGVMVMILRALRSYAPYARDLISRLRPCLRAQGGIMKE